MTIARLRRKWSTGRIYVHFIVDRLYPSLTFVYPSDRLMTQRRAVALISGGLDSMLAARVVQQQGILVAGINFYTGFCVESHTKAIRNTFGDTSNQHKKRRGALWVAEQLGIRLHTIDISEAYKSVVINPRYGYGNNINPCLDCKIMMVRQAVDWIGANGFDFIITGEVLGQRPMSQRSETLPIVAKDSGANDLLLRPLCAKLLPLTLPEREGWVNRENLFGFNGRSRKPQIELARQFGFEEYAQPAGGCCFLTDVQYSAKLVDLWHHRGTRNYELDDILLLKVGRHLRPSSSYKIIMARDEGEERFLIGYKHRFIYLTSVNYIGPVAIIDGNPTQEDILTAARLVAGYGKGKTSSMVVVDVLNPGKDSYSAEVVPMQIQDIPPEWRL